MKKQRFEGWYFKHQSAAGKSLAVIPGRAADGAFILVITDDKSYHISYPLAAYQVLGRQIRVGGSTFSPAGVALRIQEAALTLVGDLAYENLSPINGDIMGPFRFFPMECRHGVLSMTHRLRGAVALDGVEHDFTGGKGYVESDSGRSFPQWYSWVQCNAFDADASIMASVARIPFYGLRFWGCICVVWLNGREYRLATYKGVQIVRCERGHMELQQGKYRLRVVIDEQTGQKLPAPQRGNMSLFIRETLAVPARFTFTEGDVCLFDGKSKYASYEYMMRK